MLANDINSLNPVYQTVSSSTSAAVSCTTAMSFVNIPVKTGGDEVLTVTITPKKSTNILQISFSGFATSAANTSDTVVGLFQDATNNALAASYFKIDNDGTGNLELNYTMLAGTTIATTFKIRVGKGAGTGTYINADNGGNRRFGGTASTILKVIEFYI